ncbi:hypothetical protein HDV00_000062 [Rhizophlyctis rosea]|nr:hypothetical protein HDV00_000062 [Rhizophlyctis rosea]
MPSFNSIIVVLTVGLSSMDALAAPSKIPTTHSGIMTLNAASVLAKRDASSARMTYYGNANDGPDKAYGACGMEPGNMVSNYIALNPTDYRSGANCGKCIRIRSGSMCTIAKVVDLCPSCPNGGIDAALSVFGSICNGGQTEAEQVGVKSVDWDGPYDCGSISCDGSSSSSYNKVSTASTDSSSSTPSSSSSSSSSCDDYYPYHDRYTCQEQASWGKCTMWWMGGYCNRSCGRCGTGSA